MMNVKRFTLGSVATLAAISACSRGPGGAGGPGGGFEMPPTPVETATVTAGPVENVFTTVGDLEAAERVTVVSEVEGIVAELPFREGDPVPRGALLAKLDDVEPDAQLRRAEALRDQRRSTYDRVKAVVEAKAGAPQDLDDAAAALRVADAEATLARALLAKTRIQAPFAGWVGPRRVSPGAYVRAGDPIAELAQIDRLEVHFSMPERYLSQVKRGIAVAATTPAYPGEESRGEVDVVDPVVEPATRSVHVIARISNPTGRLRPGMSADVRVVLSSRDSALTVPAEAVFAEGTEFLVYKVGADGSVTRTNVVLGTRLPAAVEILSGLAAGDVVVRTGQQKLFPGAKVMPMDGAPAAGAAEGAASGEPPPGEGTP